MTRYARKKRDLDRYQVAEDAFTSEGGRLESQEQLGEIRSGASHDVPVSPRLVSKMMSRYARGVVGMMSALRISGAGPAGKPEARSNR